MGITNFLFNTITVIFLTLTLIVLLVVIMVAAGSMEPLCSSGDICPTRRKCARQPNDGLRPGSCA